MLDEYNRTVVKNILRDMLNSPRGKALGRYITAEQNRPSPQVPELKNEILDVFSEIITDLYLQPRPMQTP